LRVEKERLEKERADKEAADEATRKANENPAFEILL
jgi:hypothetical protein